MAGTASGGFSIDRFVSQVLPSRGDALIVVPPFTRTFLPLLAPHLLQAIGRQAGFRVHVLYGNLVFARLIGVRDYDVLSAIANRSLFGERVFSAAAYGLPPLGAGRERLRPRYEERMARKDEKVGWPAYAEASDTAVHWADELSAAIGALDYAVVGCTTMFEQTSASVALLRRLKQRRPQVVTVIGGANCEDEMAEGVATLCDEIDFIFSQESDASFPAFLAQLASGDRPEERIVRGRPFTELDSSPTPSYADFFRQFEPLVPRTPETEEIWSKIRVPYESSRGCWWGQKNHCTFCGLNGLGMGFREKSPERVLQQLGELAAEYPFELLGSDRLKVAMTDNIMPRGYLRSLVPRLKQEFPRARLYYEQKANLSLDEVIALVEAGIDVIQPGIETLSTSYSRRMRKGVSAPQNIALLRYAVSAGMSITWNLLTHFPGDELSELEQMLELVPLLHHLPPPTGASPLSIDRFSPYFDEPGEHGISNVRPLAAYAEAFPRRARIREMAYFFEADYECASRDNPGTIAKLERAVGAWIAAWDRDAAPPLLCVQYPSRVYRGSVGAELVLIDTRGLPGTEYTRGLTREEASTILVRRRFGSTPRDRWAVERKLAVEIDGMFVPLATAEAELLRGVEKEAIERKERAG